MAHRKRNAGFNPIPLLITLTSSLAITGVSFLDGKLWDYVFVVIGILAYLVVGFLLSLGLLPTKKASKDAYKVVFLLLLIGVIFAYFGLKELKERLLSWPLWVKILVLSVLGVSVVLFTVLTVLHIKSKGKEPYRIEQKQ